MIERIQLLMKIHQLTAADLADKLGTERSGISHFLSGRNKPSLAFVTKLLEKFPDISPDWLIMGSGAMMRGESNQPAVSAKPESLEQIEAGLKYHDPNPLMQEQLVLNDEDQAEYVSKTGQKNKEKEIKSSSRQITTSEIPEIERIVIFYNDHSFSEYKMR